MVSAESKIKGFAATWDEQLREKWPENYPKELAKLLKQQEVNNILDCSGGTGYPIIELKQLGWDVTYSDGNPEMFDFFAKKIAEKGLDIPSYLSLWHQLPENVPNTYDAVLCRGNSLLGVHAHTGDVLPSRDIVKKEMIRALQAMFNKITKGGVLYVDIPAPEYSKPLVPYHDSFQNVMTTVSYDPVAKIRTTHDVKKDPKTSVETITVHCVYPLDPEELISMLLHVGFQKIEKSPIKEAHYIDAYLAFK